MAAEAKRVVSPARQQKTEQFAQVPVRLNAYVGDSFYVLMKLIIRCTKGRAYLRHATTFGIEEFAREIGWVVDRTPLNEVGAVRQRIRRLLARYRADGLIVFEIGTGRNARYRVRLAGALVHPDVRLPSGSQSPTSSRFVGETTTDGEPASGEGTQRSGQIPDNTEGHVPVTCPSSGVTFDDQATPHKQARFSPHSGGERHVPLDSRPKPKALEEGCLDDCLVKTTVTDTPHNGVTLALEDLDPDVREVIERAQAARRAEEDNDPSLASSRHPVEGEEGVLADCQTLADAGLGEWVDS